MEEIKTVGVKTLKDQLSAYIRDVKGGCVVLITERGRLVAELHRPRRTQLLPEKETIKSQWAADGKLRLARSSKRKCQPSPVKLNAGTTATLLDQERGE